MKTVSAIIRDSLAIEGQSLADVGAKAGMTGEAVAYLRDGRRRAKLENVLPLASALRTDPGELVAAWMSEQAPEALTAVLAWAGKQGRQIETNDPFAGLDSQERAIIRVLVRLFGNRRHR